MKINLSKALRPWQKDYMNNKKRFNVLVVHRRAWKTVWAIADEVICMISEWPHDYWYIAPTYKQAKKIAWRIIQKFGDQIGDFTYNIAELMVTFKNWSTLSLFGAENPDSLRWLDLYWVIFDEYAQQPSWIYWEIIFPMINANRWWVTWIWTPKGKNAFYKLYERAKKDPRFYTSLLKYTDTNLLDEEQIADARLEMTEEEFEQEYNCSFDAFMRGAVYGKELQTSYKEWRVMKVPHNPELPVYTFWDLGISDAMTLIFMQIVWTQIHIIETYKNTWFWLEHYTEYIKDKDYTYNTHWFPHDVKQRELWSWMSRLEVASRLLDWFGKCDVVPMSTIESGINACRLIFKHLYFNEDLEEFLNDISLYQYEYDEKRGEFKKSPTHDWTSHYADALRYLAVIMHHLMKTPISQWEQDKLESNPYSNVTNEEDMTLDEIIFSDDEEEDEFEDNPY